LFINGEDNNLKKTKKPICSTFIRSVVGFTQIIHS